MRTMKDSGIAWIGEIPEEWAIKKLKYLTYCNENTLQENTNKETRINYIDISSVSENGITDIQNINFGNAPSRARRIVHNGDIIVSTVRTYLRAVAYIEEIYDNYVCSTGFAVLTSREKEILSKFLYYSIFSDFFVSTVEKLSVGISYPAITAENLQEIKILVPTLPEQHRIADYLDAKCAEIDRSMDLARQGMDKLKEYKKSVITEAVTKGLDPDVPMRDSGVPWIGEIPEGWTVHTLNNYAQLLPGFAFSSSSFSTDDGIKLLRGINIGVNSINWDECVYYKGELTTKIKVFLLKENDIVIGMDRPWISGGLRVAIMSKDDIPSLLVQRVCKICANEKIHQKYIFYILISPIFENSISGTTTGISVPHISTRQIANCKIPLPSTSEQHRIAAYLNTKCAEIDTIIVQKQALLDKLAEYKKSLIFECVTGKRDVAA